MQSCDALQTTSAFRISRPISFGVTGSMSCTITIRQRQVSRLLSYMIGLRGAVNIGTDASAVHVIIACVPFHVPVPASPTQQRVSGTLVEGETH